MPKISKTRFGDIEYQARDVITFSDGLIGFPNCTRFLILSHKPESPFRWLQSIEKPKLALLVTDPACFVQDYEVSLGSALATAMSIGEKTPTFLFTTVTIPTGKPKEMTLNLAGPIVVNVATRQGRQFVIGDEAYTMKHRVFQSPPLEELDAAA